jgi:hypothetical protein
VANDDPTELAHRLNWLFDLVRVPVELAQTRTEPPTCRAWTNQDLLDALTAQLDGPPANQRLLEQLRAGRAAAAPDTLAAIAEHFGAPAEYLTAPGDQLAAHQRRLITEHLRGWQVRTYRLCRSGAPWPDREHRLGRTVGALIDHLSADAVAVEFAETPPTADPACQDSIEQARLRVGRRAEEGVLELTAQDLLPVELAIGPRPLTHQQLRVFIAQLLDQFNLRPPLTSEQLCQALSAARGRRIRLVGAELNTTASVGHLIAMPRRDVIAFAASATTAQQTHVIHHEIMHLVCGHLDGEQTLLCGALDETTASTAGGLYATWQEREAETGATILNELTGTRDRARATARAAAGREQGLSAAFGLSNSDWR